MKNYLLFTTGDFSDKSYKSYVIDCVSDITETVYLKYKCQNNFMVMHFGTQRPYEKIEKYFKTIFSGKNLTYFLVEKTDKMSSNLEEVDMADFLMLEEIPMDFQQINMDEMELIKQLQEECFEAFQEDLINISEEELPNHKNKKTYSVDEILDKINEKGISSLTKEETNYLNSLSK